MQILLESLKKKKTKKKTNQFYYYAVIYFQSNLEYSALKVKCEKSSKTLSAKIQNILEIIVENSK